MAYQYFQFGFLLKAPWPCFLKPFIGIAASYEFIDIDTYFYNTNETKISFYEGNINVIEMIRLAGAELFNSEDLLIDGDNLIIFKPTVVFSNIVTFEGKNDIEQDLKRSKIKIEYASYSVNF